MHLEPLWVSTGIVALAEIGDKTQLLAILLAARFRAPAPILLGIFAATLANHALAAAAGYSLAAWLKGPSFELLIGLGFLIMAGWVLIPDKDDAQAMTSRGGVFLTTLLAFFLLEIGDKTQIATSLLAARFQDIALVTAGTTLGMMIANAPAVVFGDVLTKFVPMKLMRVMAALILFGTGVWIIVLRLLPDNHGGL